MCIHVANGRWYWRKVSLGKFGIARRRLILPNASAFAVLLGQCTGSMRGSFKMMIMRQGLEVPFQIEGISELRRKAFGFGREEWAPGTGGLLLDHEISKWIQNPKDADFDGGTC